MKMSRKPLVVFASLAAIVVVVIAYAYANSQHPSFLKTDGHGSACAIFPLKGNMIELANGFNIKIDTGNPVSTLTQGDVAKLVNIGAEVDSTWFPSIASDVHGKSYMTFKRYTVTFPVRSLKIDDGQIKPNPSGQPNFIVDALFLPANPGSPSTLGTDFLEKFVVEYTADPEAITLHSFRPEGYQFVSDIHSPAFSLIDFIGCGKRYYLTLNVQNDDNLYRIDTGIENIDLKLPAADTILISAPLTPSVFRTSRGEVAALHSSKVWVRLGNRSGTHSALYGTDGKEQYAVNPLNFYSQDFVLDFPQRKLYLHRTATPLVQK